VLRDGLSAGGEMMDKAVPAEKLGLSENRLSSIDGFRGMAIVLMTIGDFASQVRWVPAFLKHKPDIGLTIADLVAPMFILAIALTVRPSMIRRAWKTGGSAAMGKFALRSLSLIGIGAIITAGQAMNPPPDTIVSWGVLQCIGTACLILLPMIYAPTWVRLAAGIGLLAVYQILLDRFFLPVITKTIHNGLAGSLSWAGLLLLGTVFADLFYKYDGYFKRIFLLASGGLISGGLGLLLDLWFPIAKSRASVSYILFSLGFCLLVFALFHAIFGHWPEWLGWLRRIGRNPLALYIAHLLLLGLIVAPGIDAWYEGAQVWLSLIQAAVLLSVIISLSIYLEKKNWILKL
jgi:predicted acyltransferase